MQHFAIAVIGPTNTTSMTKGTTRGCGDENDIGCETTSSVFALSDS
jgi:hypothetical protein